MAHRWVGIGVGCLAPNGSGRDASVAATVLGMRDGFLPPTINLEAPDPECDLDDEPNAARRADIATALCHGIGFGSKNSVFVVASAS